LAFVLTSAFLFLPHAHAHAHATAAAFVMIVHAKLFGCENFLETFSWLANRDDEVRNF
jgi:hypothetical protein